MAARHVNNREPAVSEANGPVGEESLAVRPPVTQHVAHPLEPRFLHGVPGVQLNDACEAAHLRDLGDSYERSSWGKRMNALPVLHDDEVVLAETDAPVAAREIQTHRPTGAIQERSDSRWNAGWIHRRQQEGEDAERQAGGGRVRHRGRGLAQAEVRGSPALDRRHRTLVDLLCERHRCKRANEQAVSARPPCTGPEIRAHHYLHWRELKPECDDVIRRTLKVIHNHPVARFDEEDAAPVNNGIRKSTIRIVGRVGEVHRGPRQPPTQSRSRSRLPLEQPDGHRLPHPIHRDGTVRCSAAEKVAPRRLGGVAICPGVDEVRLSEGGTLYAEEIGVPSRRGRATIEWPHVANQLVRVSLPSAPPDEVTTLREEPEWRSP